MTSRGRWIILAVYGAVMLGLAVRQYSKRTA